MSSLWAGRLVQSRAEVPSILVPTGKAPQVFHLQNGSIYWPSLSLLPSDSPSSPGHSLLLFSGIHSTNMFWTLCLRIEIQLWKWSPECLPSWNLRRREKYTDRWTCGKGCDGEEIGGIETESHSSMSSTPRNKMTTEITKFGWKLSRIHECGCEFHRHWLKEGWSYNFNEI